MPGHCGAEHRSEKKQPGNGKERKHKAKALRCGAALCRGIETKCLAWLRRWIDVLSMAEATEKTTKGKGIIMVKIKVRLTLIEGMLGTSSANENVYRDFIGSKAPDAARVEDEIATLGAEAVAEKGRTVFPRLEDGTPFIYDYQIKGFFKDACSMLSRLTGKDENGKKKKAVNESSKLTAYKKIIDGLVFPQPRKIPVRTAEPVGDCQRPLRAQTPVGERVSLVSSDEIAAGATMEFEVLCLDDSLIPAVREWLDYGVLRGLGQWRNSGKGRFTWEEIA